MRSPAIDKGSKEPALTGAAPHNAQLHIFIASEAIEPRGMPDKSRFQFVVVGYKASGYYNE
jgi:hypothetical protein